MLGKFNYFYLVFSYLLCGDIPSAEATFKLQEPKGNNENVQKLIDKGLVAVAQNDYEEAYKQFQKAHDIEKNNILVRKIVNQRNYHNFLSFSYPIKDFKQHGCLFPLHWKNA